MMRAWLFNEQVAWEIPTGRIASRYVYGIYLTPSGWQVTDEHNRIAFREVRRPAHPLAVKQEKMI